jgi:hypothetical protein
VGTPGGIRSTASVTAVLFNTNATQAFIGNPGAVMMLLLLMRSRKRG